MSLYVFLGPSLPRDAALAACGAVFLPPVQQGDVYRIASLREPETIAIVDGYFCQVPAVWHKEILWAMERGIHMFGAASMGALRAAELDAFGMQGRGRIFEAYARGRLEPYRDVAFEDDDEVAVVHGPPEMGYAPLSEAMVNIRVTLAAAAQAGVVSEATRDVLVRLAKNRFYPDRTYRNLLDAARMESLPVNEVEALAAWLPDNRIDQKRADALELLRELAAWRDDAPAPLKVSYTFEHTSQWEMACRAGDPAPSPDAAVLDELRLEGDAYIHARDAAVRTIAAAIRPAAVPNIDRMLSQNHRNPAAVAEALDQEAERHAIETFVSTVPPAVIERHVVAGLRASGEYQRLEQRARDKRARLGEGGPPPSVTEVSEFEALQLRDWYFERDLGQQMPDDLDGYLEAFGFRDLDALHRVLLHEYLYRERLAAAREAGEAG